MKSSLTIMLLLICWGVKGQVEDIFVVVTLEKKTSSTLHPLEFDYWIISKSKWDVSEDSLIPLYIDGFSQTDINECCLLDTLVLFNSDSNESFAFQESFKQSLKELRSLISQNKSKIQRIKKKWDDGYKEEINVYVTPIKGAFCICELKHKDNNSMIGFKGKVAVQSGNFQMQREFFDSPEFKAIKRFDYSKLPFVSLLKMQ